MGLAQLARGLFDRRTHLSPEAMRKAIPVRNSLVETISDEEDGIVLQAPLAIGGRSFWSGIAKKMNAPATKRFELEAVGAFVWRHIDGKRTFEGISYRLREHYKMNWVEADAALGAFLQMLAQRKLITLMVKGPK